MLDPSQKTAHIRKYWGDDKLDAVLKQAEETVSDNIRGYFVKAYKMFSAVQEALS